MGLFNNQSKDNSYTDLSGLNQNNYQQFSGSSYPRNGEAGYADSPRAYDDSGLGMSLSDFTRSVFLKMFIGLAITFGIGFIGVLNPDKVIEFVGDHIGVFLVLCGIEVVMVFILGMFVRKMSSAVATVVFFVYSIVNGITIAPLLIFYDLGTVFWAFAVTAGIFGLMAFAGFVTKTDLSKFGPILFFGLIGLLIYSVIAMIFAIPMSDLIISVIGIVLFMGFTIYDTKKIKEYYRSACNNREAQKKTSIIAALQLYLDFINLFLYILRLFARNSK